MGSTEALEFALSRLEVLKNLPGKEKEVLWELYERKLEEYKEDVTRKD